MNSGFLVVVSFSALIFMSACRDKSGDIASSEFLDGKPWDSDCDKFRLSKIKTGNVSGLVSFVEFVYPGDSSKKRSGESNVMVVVSLSAPRDFNMKRINLVVGGRQVSQEWSKSVENKTSIEYEIVVFAKVKSLLDKGVFIEGFGVKSSICRVETLKSVETAILEVERKVRTNFVFHDGCPIGSGSGVGP